MSHWQMIVDCPLCVFCTITVRLVPNTAYISFFFSVCFACLLLVLLFCVFVVSHFNFLLLFSSFAVGKVENACLNSRTRRCIATFSEFSMRSSSS